MKKPRLEKFIIHVLRASAAREYLDEKFEEDSTDFWEFLIDDAERGEIIDIDLFDLKVEDNSKHRWDTKDFDLQEYLETFKDIFDSYADKAGRLKILVDFDLKANDD